MLYNCKQFILLSSLVWCIHCGQGATSIVMNKICHAMLQDRLIPLAHNFPVALISVPCALCAAYGSGRQSSLVYCRQYKYIPCCPSMFKYTNISSSTHVFTIFLIMLCKFRVQATVAFPALSWNLTIDVTHHVQHVLLEV